MLLRLTVLALFGLAAAGKDAAFFETRIRPVLAKRCYSCHGQMEMAGLRLDSRERMLRGGKSGPAVVPGKAEGSLLVAAVETAKMPPGRKLDAKEVADLREWVSSGAVWPEERGASGWQDALVAAAGAEAGGRKH
jgi:hypothetical protein